MFFSFCCILMFKTMGLLYTKIFLCQALSLLVPLEGCRCCIYVTQTNLSGNLTTW